MMAESRFVITTQLITWKVLGRELKSYDSFNENIQYKKIYLECGEA